MSEQLSDEKETRKAPRNSCTITLKKYGVTGRKILVFVYLNESFRNSCGRVTQATCADRQREVVEIKRIGHGLKNYPTFEPNC